MALARVLLVEDEPFTRTMLETSLGALGFDVVAACGSAAEALAGAGRAEVALLDLDLGPGPSGIDVAHALRDRQRDIGIVLLTSFTDPRIKDPAERPLPRGARFLVKARLADAADLRDVLLDARHAPLRSADVPTELGSLTVRQVEVLRLLAAGRSNADIADAQGVSEKAVERTVQRIMDALGIPRDDGNPRVLAARAYARLSGKSLPGG